MYKIILCRHSAELPIFLKKCQRIHLLRQLCTKSFQDVPTLKQYPLIGHSYLFLPGGKYQADRLTEAVLDLSVTLGSRFRLNLGGMTMFVTLNADDARTMYRAEGKLPQRPCFEALAHYRQKAYGSVGVVPGNGPEWHRFRTGTNILLAKSCVEAYHDRHRVIATDFCSYIDRNKHSQPTKNVFQHLLIYAIEAISIVCIGKRLNCLSQESNHNTTKIVQASNDFMNGLYATLIGLPLWKIYKTKGYKMLESAHVTLKEVIEKEIVTLNQQYRDDSQIFKRTHPFLNNLFANSEYSAQDRNILAIEIFFGGIDAIATTITFLLYFLAKNINCQEEARQQGIPFIRACIKETLRLRPTAGANSRFMVQDTKFGDFVVPKGTLVSVFSSATSIDAQYFENPLNFQPERWLKVNKNKVHNSFASLPFGHGPRMCPGRRITENQIAILIQEVLNRYHLVNATEQDVGMVYRMNRIPEMPINIIFANLKTNK